MQDGIKRLGNFIYENKYFIEDAIVDSAKSAYVATCIEKGQLEIVKFDISRLTADMNIDRVLPVRLNKLKKTRPEAFYYWYLIDLMLQNN